MTAVNFAYWLQGFFEISDAASGGTPYVITTTQVNVIKNHLNMVFVHDIDPKMGDKEHQDKLNKLHNTKGSDKYVNTNPEGSMPVSSPSLVHHYSNLKPLPVKDEEGLMRC